MKNYFPFNWILFAVVALGAAKLDGHVGISSAIAQEDPATILRDKIIAIPVSGATAETTNVLVDDIQVNAFAKIEADRIVLTVPFAERGGEFVVTVVQTDAQGAPRELFRKRYSFPYSSVIDRLDVEKSFQNDTVFRLVSRSKPRPIGFRPSDQANDFIATGRVAAVRGNWTAVVDGEIVGTDDDKRTLRADGTKVDISRGLGFLQYQGADSALLLAIGDVNVEGSLALINQGASSRGVSVKGSMFGDRLVLSASNIYGSDIRGTQRGVEAFDMENRRTSASLVIKPIATSFLGLKITANVLDVSRPSGSNFGIGEVLDGEKNTVVGGAIDLEIWDGRIRLHSEAAHSEYSNPADLNAANEFGGSTDIQATRDDAHSHRLDVDLWRGDGFSITGYGSYQNVDPLYLSVQSGSEADRETYEYGGNVTYGIASLTVSKNVFDNNVDGLVNILTTRQRSRSGQIEFQLDEFRQGEGDNPKSDFWKALPSSVVFAVSDVRVEALNADKVTEANSGISGSEIPNQVTTSLSVGLSWNWSFGSTGVEFAQSLLDTRQVGRETADTFERSINLNQSIEYRNISTTMRLGYGETKNDEISSRSAENRYEAGLTVGVKFEDLPDVTTGFDVNMRKTRFQVEGNSALSNSWRANASLNFSKYIPKAVEKFNPYLTLNGTVDQSDDRNPNIDAQRVFNYAITVALGVRF